MVFLEVLQLFVVLLVSVLFLFQIIIPIWNGTVLFPFFRSKARKLDNQLRQARTEAELAQEEQKLKNLKGKINDSETNL